jgi:hypothetical protein
MEVVVQRFPFPQKFRGEKRILSVWNCCRTCLVYPTGTVDLMTMTASGLISSTSSMTVSTEEVSKKFLWGS